MIAFLCQACDSLESISTSTHRNVPNNMESFNVIMISLDTLRADHLGHYGYHRPVSPFLDRFSSQAFIFTDVQAQAASTMHSHRSAFTSKFPHTALKKVPESNETMAGILRLSGRKTAGFADGGMMSEKYGISPGFDIYNSKLRLFKKISQLSMDWLDKNCLSPFFLFMHTYEIHSPYNPPKPYDMMFQWNFNPKSLRAVKKWSIHTNKTLENVPHTKLTTMILGLYDGGIRYSDHLMDKFFQYLHDKDLLENTIIILFSDHGESLGERDFFGHNKLYQVQLQVPLIIYIPGMNGRIVHGRFQNLDILPTLLKLLNIETSEMEFKGMDLRPFMLESESPDLRLFRISEYRRKSAESPENWKYIMSKQNENDELYYLPDDPHELNNQIENKPEIAKKMEKIIAQNYGVEPNKIRSLIHSLIEKQLRNPNLEKDRNELKDDLQNELKVLGYLQ